MATDHSSLAGAEVVSLRPYQQTLVDGVRAALRTGKRRVMAYLPTGGGKTEAYLGLAAFTMLLRRRRNPGMSGGGVSVLMRYKMCIRDRRGGPYP